MAIKTALIGARYISRYHVQAFQELPDVEVVALVEVHPDTMQAFASEFSIPRQYADLEALLRDGDVDSIVLAHPGVSLRHVGISDESLRPFLDFGIAGLECYSPSHNEATTRFCLDWCARHDLVTTGGSDCHGGFVGRELGVPPVEIADLRLGELEGRIVR